MKTLLRALLIAILAIAPAISQAATQTILVLNSQPGDYIGQGLQHTFRPPDGTFTVTTTYNSGIQVSFSGSGEFWTLDFGPPSALKFLPNEYEGAQRFPFHSPTRPGMDVSGDGRGCNRDIGRFLLSDIAFNLDGTVARLALDFEQHCEGAIPALYGSVRYNSSLTLAPRFGVGNATALKGNVGYSDGNVIVSLSAPNPSPVTVKYQTADGSAFQGVDYVATTGTMLFPANVTSQTIAIPILGDRLIRGNKTFRLLLSNPSGAALGDKTGNVKILDPNGPVTVLSMFGQAGDYISAGSLVQTSADGIFTPSRNFDKGVNVSLQNLDGWETDFAAPNNAILTAGTYLNAQRFPFQAAGMPGLSVYGAGRGCNMLTGNFNVTQASYDSSGKVRHFGADFEQHCEGGIPGLFGSVRINSMWRQMSVSDAIIDSAGSTATFTLTMNPPNSASASVAFGTVDGTAIAGIDYVATAKTVAFSAGETAHTVTVPLLSKASGKVFYGTLSAPMGAPLWIAQGSATF